MIILDTNVVSELFRAEPHPDVLVWVDSQLSADLAITAVTAAELRAGVARLPDGRRRRAIQQRVEILVDETFAGYVLPFDVGASAHYADIVDRRTRSGAPIAALDAQIAAICRQHEAGVATRNVRHFTGTGIVVVNPWQPR